jgi:predicted PurR-regulated permease PerM
VQLVVAVTDALGIVIGALALGLPLAVPIGVIVFFGAFVPVVGAIVAGIVAVMVTFVSSGFTPALIILVIVVLVQQFDTDLLAPIIYGRAVRLHPVVVLVVLTAGGAVAGIAGAFVAVPITAVVSAVGGDIWRRRTGSDPRYADDVLGIEAPTPDPPPADE